MGDYAYLHIGSKEFSSKYEVPYSWCMIFEGTKPVRGIFKLDVHSAKEKMNSTGLTLDKLEEKLAEFTGLPAKRWKRYRQFILTDDTDGLEKHDREAGMDPDDDDYQNAFYLLEDITEEGLYELVTLYELLIALEVVKHDEIIRLNVRELRGYYDEIAEVFLESKRNFTDKVSMYNYLFSYTVPNNDQIQLVFDKLQVLPEDVIIRDVLVPLLIKSGYQNVVPNDYHGPGELGVDTQLFYKFEFLVGRFYYAAQVKAINIHTNSRKEGHVASVSEQLSLALDSKFVDPEDNEEKSPDRVMLVTSGRINDGARKYLHNRFCNRPIVIMDGKKLAEGIVRLNLVERIIQIKVPNAKTK
jgi:hypothetical protein